MSHKEKYEALPIPIEVTEADRKPETMESRLTGRGGGSKRYDWDINDNSAKVLVPGEPDGRFPLKGFEFTGMGYFDEALHIQFAVKDALQNDNHGYFFLRDKEGNDLIYDYSLSFVNHGEPEGRIDYQECVFEIPEKALSEYSLYGYFVTSGNFQEGNWTVTFPLEKEDK